MDDMLYYNYRLDDSQVDPITTMAAIDRHVVRQVNDAINIMYTKYKTLKGILSTEHRIADVCTFVNNMININLSDDIMNVLYAYSTILANNIALISADDSKVPEFFGINLFFCGNLKLIIEHLGLSKEKYTIINEDSLRIRTKLAPSAAVRSDDFEGPVTTKIPEHYALFEFGSSPIASPSVSMTSPSHGPSLSTFIESIPGSFAKAVGEATFARSTSDASASSGRKSADGFSEHRKFSAMPAKINPEAKVRSGFSYASASKPKIDGVSVENSTSAIAPIPIVSGKRLVGWRHNPSSSPHIIIRSVSAHTEGGGETSVSPPAPPVSTVKIDPIITVMNESNVPTVKKSAAKMTSPLPSEIIQSPPDKSIFDRQSSVDDSADSWFEDVEREASSATSK